MIPAEQQRLTDHLAEKVCGWETKREHGLDYWFKGPALVLQVAVFLPLTDPRDCAIVMEAWRKQGGTIDLHVGDDGNMAAANSKEGHSGSCWLDVPWTKAVTLAIGRASGFDGEGK